MELKFLNWFWLSVTLEENNDTVHSLKMDHFSSFEWPKYQNTNIML